MVDDPFTRDLTGLFYIEFIGETEPKRARIYDRVVTTDAHIIYLIGEGDTIYNWSTIIKMTKIKEPSNG